MYITVFFITRQYADARYWYTKSVRPSIHLSVRYVPVSDENGFNISSQFFSPHGSQIILVVLASNIFTKFWRGHPLRGR